MAGVEESEIDTYFTVFDGSSSEDVFHAKLLWNSLSLLPPLESRLVSSDIRQRLPVARPPDTSAAARKSTSDPRKSLQDPNQQQRQEERQRYMNMAKQKEEIMSLLRKHREQRIQKERVSLPYKPKQSDKSEGLAPLKPSEDLEKDMEEVKQLQ